jgi:hypothetical protein
MVQTRRGFQPLPDSLSGLASGTKPLAHYLALDQLRLEHNTHAGCAIAAHTDEANAAAHKLLNRRNSNVLAQASSHDIARFHGQQ